MLFVFWQLVAATERAGARQGTEHPKSPHIYHTPSPAYPQPHCPACHSPRLCSHAVKVILNCQNDIFLLCVW